MSLLHPELYWLIIGVMLLLLELAMPGFILFFFGVGALVVSAVVWLLPTGEVPVAGQLCIFLVVSLLTLAALRGVILKKFFARSKIDEEAHRQEEDEDVIYAKPGERAVITLAINPPAEGQLKYGGTFWRATAEEPLAEGEIACVVHQRDLVIHVKKWKEGE